MTKELFTYRKTAGKHRDGRRVLGKGSTVRVSFVEDLANYGDASTWTPVAEEAPSRTAMRKALDDDPSIVAVSDGKALYHIHSALTGKQLSRSAVSHTIAQKLVSDRQITVPRMWDGEDVFIIGGGPSVAEMNLDLIHSKCVIGVNQAFELGEWVDICFFVDQRWMKWNIEQLTTFPNMKISALGNADLTCGIKAVARDRQARGMSKEPNTICYNMNGGAAAINLAAHLGAHRIFLIGFDMKVTDGRHNWHDKHAHVPKDTIYAERFLESFGIIKADARRAGIEIINVTPDSALNDFPKGKLEDFIEEGENA